MNRYDAIVIGSGIAGLFSAALLAKHGKKVLLFEAEHRPGGSAGSFRRGRFEFEISLHELCQVGTKDVPNEIYNCFAALGKFPSLVYEDNLFRSVDTSSNGFDVTLPAGKEPFIGAMERYVPGSGKSIRELLETMERNNDAIIYSEDGDKENALVFLAKYRDFLRFSAHTVDEVLDAYSFSPQAKKILSSYWPYLGVRPDRLNAFHYFSMMRSYIVDRPAFPRFRSTELVATLLSSFFEHGGELRLSSPVEEILYEGKRAIGVVSHGQSYYAKDIVADIAPTAIERLSKDHPLPKRFRQLNRYQVPSASAFTIYLGLNAPISKVGLTDYTVFVTDGKTSHESIEDHDYVLNSLNVPLPEASPEGTSMLFFTVLVDPSKIPEDLSQEEYIEWKTSIAKSFIARAEKDLKLSIFPYIEEIEVGTPFTFARYLRTPYGSIYGTSVADEDSMMARIRSQKKDDLIPGLTLVGGFSSRGDGYNVAFNSGRKAVEHILKKEGKRHG